MINQQLHGEIVGKLDNGSFLFRTTGGIELEISPDQFVPHIDQDLLELDEEDINNPSLVNLVIEVRKKYHTVTRIGPNRLVIVANPLSTSDVLIVRNFFHQSFQVMDLFDEVHAFIVDGLCKVSLKGLLGNTDPMLALHSLVSVLASDTIRLWTSTGVCVLSVPDLNYLLSPDMCTSIPSLLEIVGLSPTDQDSVIKSISLISCLQNGPISDEETRLAVQYKGEYNKVEQRMMYTPRSVAEQKFLLNSIIGEIRLRIVQYIVQRTVYYELRAGVVLIEKPETSTDIMGLSGLLATYLSDSGNSSLSHVIEKPITGLFAMLASVSTDISVLIEKLIACKVGIKLGDSNLLIAGHSVDIEAVVQHVSILDDVGAIVDSLLCPLFGTSSFTSLKCNRRTLRTIIKNDVFGKILIAKQSLMTLIGKCDRVKYIYTRPVPFCLNPGMVYSTVISEGIFFNRYISLGISGLHTCDNRVFLIEDQEMALNKQVIAIRKAALLVMESAIIRWHCQKRFVYNRQSAIVIQQWWREYMREHWAIRERILLKKIQQLNMLLYQQVLLPKRQITVCMQIAEWGVDSSIIIEEKQEPGYIEKLTHILASRANWVD